MDLKQKVLQSFLWKQGPARCAQRIGISVMTYNKLKQEIQKEQEELELQLQEADLEEEIARYVEETRKLGVLSRTEDLSKGTAEFKVATSTQPMSAEEIEELIHLDKTKWKLSKYSVWNSGDNDTWLTSAKVSAITQEDNKEDILKSVLENYKFEYTPVEEKHLNLTFKDEKVCAVLSLQDIHIGKQDIGTPVDIIASAKRCVENLVLRSYQSCYLDKVILVLGGDLLQCDTFKGTTSSLETYVDCNMSTYDAYKLAFDLMLWTINYVKQFCNTLEVVYIPGNHSRTQEANIAYAMSKCIVDPNIIWDIEYNERKVTVYGKSMICLEHGDYNTNKSPLVFASEYPKIWGATEYRVLYTGHYHKHKKIEYITTDETNGFITRILPSLTGTDAYHYSNKWTKNLRGGIIELHSETKGPIGEWRYYE